MRTLLTKHLGPSHTVSQNRWQQLMSATVMVGLILTAGISFAPTAGANDYGWDNRGRGGHGDGKRGHESWRDHRGHDRYQRNQRDWHDRRDRQTWTSSSVNIRIVTPPRYYSPPVYTRPVYSVPVYRQPAYSQPRWYSSGHGAPVGYNCRQVFRTVWEYGRPIQLEETLCFDAAGRSFIVAGSTRRCD